MRTRINAKSSIHVAVVVVVSSFLVMVSLPMAGAEETVELRSADPFAILAGSTVTNTGPSVIHGDIGLHPGSAVTGFEGTATVNGEFHIGDEVAERAKVNLTAAYLDAAGRPVNQTLPSELGSEELFPGVYDSLTGAFGLTGTVTLDAQGDPDAVWIFQMDTTLITAVDSSVVLTNGAQACNVFWQVGSSATLATRTDFKGNILAKESITMNDGATIHGRALARDAAVTLINNVITVAECAPAEEPPTEEPPTEEPPTEVPPTEEPPTEEPPTEEPPTADPPTEGPPTEDPPTEAPPTDEHPAACSTDLVAIANADTSIVLTWNSIAGAEQYRIHRAVGDGAFALHDQVEGNATSFIDTHTEVGEMYRYEVRPVVAGVESEGCDVVEVTAIPVFSTLLATAAASVIGLGAYVASRRTH